MSLVHRFPWLLLAVLCSFSASGETVFRDPTPEELAMKSAAMAPGAHAVILDWDRRQDDVDAWESEHLRIKIFDREGAKYADLELPFFESWSWIKDIQARTIHADGTIIPFDGKTFDKVLAQQVHGPALSMKTFTLPDVQPGSIIEYFYVRRRANSTLLPTYWVVQHELPVSRETIWFRPWRATEGYFTSQGLPPGKTMKEDGVHFELSLENVAAYEGEPYAPPDLVTKSQIAFHYADGETDPVKYWADEGGARARFAGYSLTDSRVIRKAADEATAGVASADEKLRHLYARVQRIRSLSYEARPTEVELRKGDVTANLDADDALEKGYGSHAQINHVFVSLARAAGFEAYIVRAASRRERFFARNVPDFSQLDYDIALVVVDGKERFFDPATPMTPYGLLPWPVTSVPAMKFVKKGVAPFIQTPRQLSGDAIMRRKANLHVDAGGVVKGTVTVAYTGQLALQRRLVSRSDDEAVNRKTIEESVKQWLPEGSAVKVMSLRGMKGVDEPVTADLDVELPNLGASAGSRLMLPLAIFSAASKNPFVAERRKYDIYFPYESRIEDHVVLTLPAGYAVEALPDGAASDLGLLAFESKWSRGDGTVTLDRTFSINSLLIPKAHYPHVRAFYDRSLAADRESVVLTRASKETP